MPDDQGEGYHERNRRARVVAAFLNEHFTPKQIAENGTLLSREAEKLLFDTKPFEVVPSLQENIRRSFEQCMDQEYVPVAAGVEAAEEKQNKALGKCCEETGYRENGCSPSPPSSRP